MNTTTNLSSSFMKTLFIMFMKYAGAFVRPKDTTVNSNCPYLVTKAFFRDVTLSNLHLMIARSEINLGEILGTSKLIKQIIDSWQRVLVLDGDCIQVLVVNAHSHRAILLLNKQTRDPQGEALGLIYPFEMSSSSCFLSSASSSTNMR